MSRFVGRWAALALLLGVGGLSCNTTQITTPSRTLDRPSDVALYCMELEIDNCLPDMNPDDDPTAYLNAYCDQSRIDYANNTQPRTTVLALSECDDDHRRARLDNYLAPLHRAAQAAGRDANYPCCAVDDTGCTTLTSITPACTRRVLGALVTNTSRGELAVADTQAQGVGLTTVGRLENLHSGQPGFGFLPTGLMPEHVRSFSPPGSVGAYGRQESPGAWAVTANSGSCDFSVVSVDKIVHLAERAAICYSPDHQADEQCSTRTCDSDSCPQRVEPWLPGAGNARRPLISRPSWMEVAPWSDGTRRVMMVAYPTCGLVATVDLGPVGSVGCDPAAGCGRITDAMAFDATGKPRILSATDLTTLECAADCSGDSTTSLMPDPNNLPDGGIKGIPVLPATLAIEAAGQRLLIGNAVGTSITVVDFDGKAADGSRFLGTPRSIPLDFSVLPESLRGGQPGLDSIRVSPRTPAGQFAYVVAHDSTVRVIDLDREVECETNPDPRYLQAHAGDTARVLPDELNDSNLRRLSCFPVGPATPRAPLAVSSGITLGNASLPRDVGFVHSDVISCDTTDPLNCPLAPGADPTIWPQMMAKVSLWLGDFAWIMGGGGVATAVQVADYCPEPAYRACFPDAAALRRVSFLHTRSQYLPSPEILNLPGFYQALMVSPNDRLTNVKRVNSRFEESIGTFGPRTDIDSSGIPSFTTRVLSTAVSWFEAVSDANVNAERRRLLLPTPASYYYLPVDPVCDIALSTHASPDGFASPDGILPLEPTRRPMSMVQFTDARALTDTVWSLDWEGVLGGLVRTSGRLLGDGTLIDLNGLYCSRGVESGDKVWLTGCQSDTDCFNGSTCHREAAQGFDPGICLTNDQAAQCRALSQQLLVDNGNDTVWAATWQRRYRVTRAEQQVPIGAAGSGDVADRLILDEIAEPEYEIERQSCTNLGDACSGTILLPGRTVDTSKPSPKLACRGVGTGAGGALQKSCILECKSNVDCGVGFVCAHSRYEADEVKAGFSSAASRPRCVHAPLVHPQTPILKNGSWQPMGISAASALLAACYPDLSNYEVHGGDSFLVHGDRTGAPSLVQRAADGSCQRPPAGSASYNVSRLMEPRLRMGPRDALPDTDPQRCPSSGTDWLSHRVPAIPEAVAQPSCQSLRPTSAGGVHTIQLPGLMNGTLDLVRGEDFKLPAKGSAQATKDPWLASEFELFSGLRLDGGRNQCILTGAADERYPTSDEANGCSGFCRFPGDHTELAGVRRIHFENPLGNMVLRVPRVLRDSTRPYSDCHDLSRGSPTTATCSCKAFDPGTKLCTDDNILSWNEAVWSVPPDGYSVTFVVVGGLTTYALPVQTAQLDVSSGVPAQGLKSVTAGPSGSLYIVDEGRSGQLSGLRGQVLRILGSTVDASFLLR